MQHISRQVIHSCSIQTFAMSKYQSVFWAIVVLQMYLRTAFAIHWDQSHYLSPEFRMLWSIQQQEITFEIQVRTTGYIGLGFSRDGTQSGADLAVGWIAQGQTYFQDRHMKRYGAGDVSEPLVDPSQDYELLLGYENVTHTVMRFKRKLDTCDTSHDVSITNDTMRIIYMFHDDEPENGSVLPGSLPSPQVAFRGYVPLTLTQRTTTASQHVDPRTAAAASFSGESASSVTAASNNDNNDASASRRPGTPTSTTTGKHQFALELRNQDVELPQADDTRFWCKVFELQDFRQKHHLTKYEPIFDSVRSRDFLQHINLYGCQGHSSGLESMSRQGGHVCANRNNPAVPCNAIIASWTRGSEGFAFPPEAGYPFESTANERFYLMESHYNNPNPDGDLAVLHLGPMVDNSGLKLFFTPSPRKHDAGVISIGMDPNWRHIIPPGHEKVISEGHCIDDCTRKAFPSSGISVVAVLMQTHNIGKEIKLRQIRKNEELLPIAVDANVHRAYGEYRRIAPPIRVLPGDSLVVECMYNSSSRDAITLGGLTTRGETCTAAVVYYPRQKKLSTCHSLPSLPTVLHSLGIDELAMNSQPVLIASPPALAGMTLEERLVSYDWERHFDSFQRVTRSGSFRAVCLDVRNHVVTGTDTGEHFSPMVTKVWRAPTTSTCPQTSSSSASGTRLGDDPSSTIHLDSNNIYVTEMATRRKTPDDPEVESMSLSGAPASVVTSLLMVLSAFSLLLPHIRPNVFVAT